ncbi:DUF11 domain-containing protein [Candidatus Woesearchaeota archaeon]|nr:DUF11 domain-containing protein [Candidatus Woesearchaeota archaeon]
MVSKSRLVVLLLIVMGILAASANAGEVFNEEVHDNTAFYIDNIKHIVRYYPSAKKVSLLAGEERVLIAVQDCEELGKYKYCIDSATEGIDDETGDPMSTMELRVIESGPSIELERDVSEDEPNVNEEVEVIVTIENTGNERVTNMNYVDDYPTSVKITGSNKNMLGNGILWTGSLNPGESKTLTYRLTFTDFMTLNSTAEANYVFNSKVSRVKSDTVSFSVKTPFNLTEYISPKSAGLGEEITYTLNISNTDAGQDITISNLEMTVPKGALITKRDLDLDNVDGKVTYSGKISASAEKSFSIKFKASTPTKGKLTVKLDIKVGSKTFSETFTHEVGMGVSDIMPSITFTPSEVKGGSELEIEAGIVNNGEYTISSISLDMASDIIDGGGWRNIELAPGKKHYVFNKIINAPGSDEKDEYYVKLSGSYLTKTGKLMKFESEETVTVLPQEKMVELVPSTSINGRKVNVTLGIKNIAGYNLTYISMIDTFPKGFKSEGTRDLDIEELGISEQKTAYSYLLTVPDDYKKDWFEITHSLSGLGDDEVKFAYEKKTNVSLDGESSGAAKTGETGNETSNQTAGTASGGNASSAASEDTQEDKPGVFTRMWNWFKGLFTKEPEDRFE